MAFKNTFENGTNGANLTIANSGGANGDAFNMLVIDNVSAPGGASSVQYATTAAYQGAMGLLITLSASTTYMRWEEPTSGPRGGLRRPYKHVAHPSTSATLASIRCEGGGPLSDPVDSSMGDLIVDSAGRLCLSHASSGIDTASRYQLVVGTTYWIEFFVEKGTTTTNGKTWLRVLAADGTTVLNDYTSTTSNTRSSNVLRYRFAGATTATGWTSDTLDSLQAGLLPSGFLGPLPNQPPVVSISPVKQAVAAGAAVSATATASDPDGTIATYAWSVDYCSTTAPTLSNASTSTVNFTAPAAGHLVVLKCLVTDSDGASTSVTTEIRVPTSAATLAVLPDDSGKGHTVKTPWAVFGAAANAAAALSDGSGATGVESADVTSTPTVSRHRLAPSTTRSNAKITLAGVAKTDSGAITAKAMLYEGTTLRQTWTLTPTTTPTSVDLALSGATVAAIIDWSDLWVALSAEV